MGLGWHVLGNHNDDEGLDPQKFNKGRFFESDVWCSVPASDQGVRALQAKLSRVLHHIKSGVPALLGDIQESVSNRKVEVVRLGKPKSTPQDMQIYPWK